ncbi:MAG: hypothetical protein IT365_14075 [Candidatus Hydrogenedentes bacterium]|nr:hypothetical protein [Candidatus Hydrogenedentota bacterium]
MRQGAPERKVPMPEVIYEFKQRAFLKDTRTFTVYDDDTICASYRELWNRYEYSRPLREFDHVPRNHVYFDTSKLVGALLTAAFAILLFVLGHGLDRQEGGKITCYFLSALSAFSTIIFLVALRRYSHRILTFVSESSNNLFDNVVLLWQLPSPESFEEFVEFLKTQIAQARARSSQSGPQSIAQQLQDLARLKEEGHLTLYEFEKAKALIIDGREKP